MSLNTIIFDFGGVLYNIDYFAATRRLAELSSQPDILSNLPHLKILELPGEYEKGNISSEEFRDFLRYEYKISANDDAIDNAWNAMLLGLKAESYDFVESLKYKYKLALLSNTNEIHHNYFNDECKGVLSLFDYVIFSHNTGMRKPDVEIYNYTLKTIQSNASETLFIDDSIVNIDGAKSAGLATIHFSENLTLSDLLHTI
ncbi:MAG: HAD family phosphatase [Candidatus Kapabacteria bacterium]|nr:HAD family phosphatase [Ignavibacteriota bacterium]MCW5886007.1 HAD family phosphatase [Candidatus Kapabacteria bacterium]